MNKNPFWELFKTVLKGPKAMVQKVEKQQREDKIIRKLENIKGFVEATNQITQSEVGQQWANDCLREIDELIRMHSHED